jgi:hypothetical protein
MQPNVSTLQILLFKIYFREKYVPQSYQEKYLSQSSRKILSSSREYYLLWAVKAPPRVAFFVWGEEDRGSFVFPGLGRLEFTFLYYYYDSPVFLHTGKGLQSI